MSGPISVRLLASVVLAGVAYYIGAVILLHLIQPELNPLQSPISGYVKGHYPLLATTTFFAFATAVAALSLGLRKALPRSRTSAVGVSLLWVAVGGLVIAGIFAGPPMHLVGGVMAIPSLFIAFVGLSVACRRAPQFEDLGRPLLVLAILATAIFLVAIMILHDRGLAGLGQRLFFAAIFGWMAMVAWRMMRLSTSAPGDSQGSPPKTR